VHHEYGRLTLATAGLLCIFDAISLMTVKSTVVKFELYELYFLLELCMKVQVCNLRLIDNIKQIGHSDANIEWSSDEHLD